MPLSGFPDTTHPGADPLLTEAQAAHLLTLRQTTLQAWRQRGTGPAFLKIGAAVRYRRSTIEAWLASRTAVRTGAMAAR